MALQKIFTDDYVTLLSDDVKKGTALYRYDKAEFEYDPTKTMEIAGVLKPEGLLDKMPIDDDFQAAIALYEAYKDLKRIHAADESLWVYLTHVDLFPYVQKKFNKVVDLSDPEQLKKKQNSIGIHWFFQRETVRNAIAGLWWDVECTIDKNANNREDKYRYTKFLFDHYDLRMMNFANYALFRNKNQVFGILGYLMEHNEIVKDNFKYRSRFITKHFNLLGATRQLAYLPEGFFHEEMDRIHKLVMEIDSKGNIEHDDENAQYEAID